MKRNNYLFSPVFRNFINSGYFSLAVQWSTVIPINCSGSTLFKNATTGARGDIVMLREIHLYSCDKKCTANGHFSYPSVHSICSYSYTNFEPLTRILPIRAG
ncbi:hypothetical protein EK904_007574 [Melospiza melodia maxima]|nr:hypothetical protein EK904_007574 [Melospiza melodia maxima]